MSRRGRLSLHSDDAEAAGRQHLRASPSLAARVGTATDALASIRMILPFISWIWQVRGTLALAPGQSSDNAFDRLAPLFHQPGTRHERINDTLTFQKKDQAAQDKMSVFDSGVLRIEKSATGSTLRYQLTSRALLFCFLAPLLFLAFAQITIVVNDFYAPGTSAADKLAAAKAEAKEKEAEEKLAKMPMNPIDKALGAPAPDKPGEKDKNDDKKKPSPTTGYVFAGIFAVLYVVGRILEDRLVRSLFQRKLLNPSPQPQ
jgi:hypothetical protein